jgi:hypothetical protein
VDIIYVPLWEVMGGGINVKGEDLVRDLMKRFWVSAQCLSVMVEEMIRDLNL